MGEQLHPRSFLYVPGDRPERFPKALASGADAVIFDLEDAVPVAAKARARSQVVELLGAGPADATGAVPQRWVRINAGDAGLADLEELAGLAGLAGVVVAKSSAASLAAAHALAPEVACIGLVEDARALLSLAEIARSPGVVALAMGEVDLAADLGVALSADNRELAPVRMQVVVTSAAFDLAPPIGPVSLEIGDDDAVRRTTIDLRRQGFGARQVIHPSQVPPVNEALTPTAEEIATAERLLALAAAAGGGACTDDDGRMIDEAVLRSARHTLARRREERGASSRR